MAKKQVSIPADEKLDNQDFDMFKALEALDRKDYEYYSGLSEEQKKKFVPYVMLQWMSSINGKSDLQKFYLLNTDAVANANFLNDKVSQHPELQWKLLCASSLGMGKQFHKWVPTLKKTAQQLKEPLTNKETVDYLTKVYPTASATDIKNVAELYTETHKHKCWLADKLPELKLDDIDTLSQIFSISDALDYEKNSGKN